MQWIGYTRIMRSKYGNKKTLYNGRWYDSKREAEHSAVLDSCKKAKRLKDRVINVEYQKSYILQEKFIDDEGKKHQPIRYIADFVVEYADGHIEIQDVKSEATITPMYNLKKKMMLFKHKIKIVEIL
jgi:hypothetical protein